MLPDPGAIGSINRPQHGHRRRLPVTERVFGNVFVNEFRIIGHDAWIEDQKRQAVPRSYQDRDRKQRASRRHLSGVQASAA